MRRNTESALRLEQRQRANLNEGDVGRKLLFHTFDPLQRKSEGVEIGHNGADVPVFHKTRQRQLRLAAQEVELNVQA